MHARLRARTALLALATLAGCGNINERQRMWLAEGERAFQNKQHELAVDRLSLFLGQVEDRPEAARALYVRSMSLALAGRRAQAYTDLQQAARQRTDPQVAWRAQAVLGVLHFEDQNWAAAARAFGRATDQMPSIPPIDALLYRLGLCHERTGRWPAALTAYQRLLSAFPRGAYAGFAQRRLQLKADHFAVQCGVFSRSRGAASLVAELRQKGLEAYVRRELRGDQLYHVVLVGRHDSYASAVRALAEVRGHVPGAVLWP